MDNREGPSKPQGEGHLGPLTPKVGIRLDLHLPVQEVVIIATLPSIPVMLTSSQPRKRGMHPQSLQHHQVSL